MTPSEEPIKIDWKRVTFGLVMTWAVIFGAMMIIAPLYYLNSPTIPFYSKILGLIFGIILLWIAYGIYRKHWNV